MENFTVISASSSKDHRSLGFAGSDWLPVSFRRSFQAPWSRRNGQFLAQVGFGQWLRYFLGVLEVGSAVTLFP
jgi:hypothetical protein